MAYTPNYTSGDLSDIIIDALGNMFVEVVAFASLIILVILYAWFRKKGRF